MLTKVKINEELKNDVNNTLKMILEEMYLVCKYYLIVYFKCRFYFGITSPITKDVEDIWFEFLKIKKRERILLKRMIKSGGNIDDYGPLLDDLDELDAKTVQYYIDSLEEFETAIDLKQDYRAKRVRKDFLTLLEDDEMFINIYESTINLKEITSYLKLSKDFIRFMTRDDFHIYYVDDLDEDLYGVNIKEDENGNIIDLRLTIPDDISDIDNTLIVINLLKKCYLLYQNKNKKLTDAKIEEIENISKDTENKYHEELKEKEKTLLYN